MITSNLTSISTTPVRVGTAEPSGTSDTTISGINTGSFPVYFGGEDVVATEADYIAPSGRFEFILQKGDELFMVCDTGESSEVAWTHRGV